MFSEMRGVGFHKSLLLMLFTPYQYIPFDLLFTSSVHSDVGGGVHAQQLLLVPSHLSTCYMCYTYMLYMYVIYVTYTHVTPNCFQQTSNFLQFQMR